MDQSYCWFPVTFPILRRTVHCILSHYYTTSVMVLISTFTGSLLQKPPSSAMQYADWFNCLDVTRHGLTSDKRRTMPAILTTRIIRG